MQSFQSWVKVQDANAAAGSNYKLFSCQVTSDDLFYQISSKLAVRPGMLLEQYTNFIAAKSSLYLLRIFFQKVVFYCLGAINMDTI